MYSVFLIDDEPWSIIDAKETLNWARFGFQVTATFQDPIEALQTIRHNPPDVIFTDIRMPEISGLDIIAAVKKEKLNCICVILSGFTEFELARQAVSLGAYEYCLKPISPETGNQMLMRLEEHLKELHGIEVTEDVFPNEAIRRMTEYIELNLHKKIMLEDLAAHCYLTPAYCSKLFAKNLNTSFSQYLLDKRIEYAKRLMHDPQISLAQVAQRAGFSDQFYFSKCFKKVCGLSPSEYIKSQRDKKL